MTQRPTLLSLPRPIDCAKLPSAIWLLAFVLVAALVLWPQVLSAVEEPWTRWPWTVEGGGGSTIPYLLSDSSQPQPITLRGGATLTLAGLVVTGDRLDGTLSAIPLATDGTGPVWLEQCQLLPQEGGRVLLDSRQAQLPGWQLRGLWRPQSVTAERSVDGDMVTLTVTCHQLGEFQAALHQPQRTIAIHGQAAQVTLHLAIPLLNGELGAARLRQVSLSGSPAHITLPDLIQGGILHHTSSRCILQFNDLGESQGITFGTDHITRFVPHKSTAETPVPAALGGE